MLRNSNSTDNTDSTINTNDAEHVAVVKSTKIAVEEINKTCKALKSRAFYYSIYKIIFYIRYYIRCEGVYKT